MTAIEKSTKSIPRPADSTKLENCHTMEAMLNVGENGPFICCICQPQKPFKNSTGLRNHIGWKHSNSSKPAEREAKGGYKCDVCGMAIRGYAALSVHKWKKHGMEQLHKCNRCDKTFGKLRLLHKHMAEEHEIQMFKCETCNSEFRSREGWRMHRTKMHLTEEPLQICYICGKAFKMPYQLKNHLKLTHKTIRDFACHLCTRTFKGCQSLRRHLLTFHSNDRSFSCSVCESKFKTRADMSSHRKLHFRPVNPLPTTGRSGFKKTLANGSYACQYCSKTFSKSLGCKAHEKLIHEYKEAGIQFVCISCDKAFPNQYYLIHHINNKHHQRNHRCPHCERLYSQAYLLKRHLPKCTGTVLPKPYNCERCGLKFATKNNLHKHRQYPDRCHNKSVDCVILVDDGLEGLSFENGVKVMGENRLPTEQPALLGVEVASQSYLNSEDSSSQVVVCDYSVQVFDGHGLELSLNDRTMDESCIPVSAEEQCVMAYDANEIETNR